MTRPPRSAQPHPPWWPWRALAWVLVLGGLALPAWADSDDHDQALQAVQRGEAISLQQLLNRVPELQQGHVLEVELERDHGRWIYEIKSLDPGGKLVKRKLDARTGEILQSRTRGRP